MLFRLVDDRKRSSADTGMELNIGIRQWLGPQLEVGGKAGYVSIDNNDDWLGSVYARFHATELFSRCRSSHKRLLRRSVDVHSSL